MNGLGGIFRSYKVCTKWNITQISILSVDFMKILFTHQQENWFDVKISREITLIDSEVLRKTVFTSSCEKKNFDSYWESSTTPLDLCMLNLNGEENCNFTKMQRNMLKQTLKVIIHGVSAKHGYANCFAFAFLTVSESYFPSKMYLDSKMFYNFEIFSIWMS